MKELNIIGENVYINNKFVISESFLENLFSGKNGKSAWLGNMLSFIPGFAPKEQKEKLDKYQTAVQNWARKWQETRKKDLEDEMAHKLEVRTNRYEIDQQKRLNKHDAEKKVKEFKRKQETDAQKAILAQLKREQARINDYIIGPSTPDAMAAFIEATEKLYENATPAEQKLKDNVAGMMADVFYVNESGNERFLNPANPEDKKKMEENAQKYKGMYKDDPEMLRVIDDFVSNAPKNETEFNEKFANVIVNDPESKTVKELNDDAAAIKDYVAESRRLNDVAKKADKAYNDAKAKQEKLQAKKHAADDAQGEKTRLEGLNTPKDIRADLIDNIKAPDKDKDGNDIPVFIQDGTDDKGHPNWKVNPASNTAKLMMSAGMKEDDIKMLMQAGAEGNPPTLKLGQELTDMVDDKVKDEDCTKYKNAQIKHCDKVIEKFTAEEQNQLDTLNNTDETKPGSLKQLQKAQEKANDDVAGYKVSNEAEKAMEIARQYNPKLKEEASLSEIESTITGIDTKISERNTAMEHVAELRTEARKLSTQKQRDDTAEKTLAALSPDERNKIENPSVNLPSVYKQDPDQNNREYIETDLKDKDGNPIRLYKPSKDSPNYDEEIRKYDEVANAKLATAKLEPAKRPEITDGTDKDQIAAQRQWDVNFKAKEAAKQRAIEQYKKDKADQGEPVKDEEAQEFVLNMLADKEFLSDAGDIDGLDTEGNGEDENGEDAQLDANDETVTKEKEAQRAVDAAQEAYDNASDEEKEQKKKDLEKAQEELKKAQEAREDKEHKSGVKNPAKIWKRRKKENGQGSTKNYYYIGANAKMKGQSISPTEYKKRLENYKKKKEVKQDKQSFQDNRPVIFEKRKWTTTPLFGNKK